LAQVVNLVGQTLSAELTHSILEKLQVKSDLKVIEVTISDLAGEQVTPSLRYLTLTLFWFVNPLE